MAEYRATVGVLELLQQDPGETHAILHPILIAPRVLQRAPVAKHDLAGFPFVGAHQQLEVPVAWRMHKPRRWQTLD